MDETLSITQLYQLLKQSQEEQTNKILLSIENTYKNKIEDLEKKYQTLEKKYLQSERKLRKNNLVIFGLTVHKENIVQQTVAELNSLLQTNILITDVNNCYTIGKQGILLELTSYLKKQEIFKNLHKLKGTGRKISIVNDLCPEDQKNHKKLREHQKIARQNKKQAKIKGNLLEIEGKLFTLEQLEQKEESETDEEEEIDSEILEEPEEDIEGSTSANPKANIPKTTIGNKRKRHKKNSPITLKKSSRLYKKS